MFFFRRYKTVQADRNFFRNLSGKKSRLAQIVLYINIFFVSLKTVQANHHFFCSVPTFRKPNVKMAAVMARIRNNKTFRIGMLFGFTSSDFEPRHPVTILSQIRQKVTNDLTSHQPSLYSCLFTWDNQTTIEMGMGEEPSIYAIVP